MAVEFRDKWLESFYEDDKQDKRIPKRLEPAPFRKIQVLDGANKESDLRIPPGSRFEHLTNNLSEWCSIRVNRQYRLVFKWIDGVAVDTHLDPHTYKG